jgi:hypothetical protein
MYYSIYASSEENYMYYDYNKPINQTNNLKVLKDERINPTCIICWVDTETPPKLLKQNIIYIAFCDCNTYIHEKCLRDWYCKTFSCPICRSNLIYDPSFTHRVRLRRKFIGCINYGVYIIKRITNIIFVFAAWNIALNIICNIYLVFYSINIKK